MSRRAIAAAAALGLVCAAATAPAATPTLPQVLRSALRHHPKLRAAEARVAASRARLLRVEGAFDPSLGAEVGAAPIGADLATVGLVGVSQKTALSGLRWQGGWRIGADHPVYAGKQVTASAGELFAKVALPLLRGRAIDKARAARRKAALSLHAEDLKLRKSALALAEAAGRAWTDWRVAAALQDVEAQLFALAERRAGQLEARVRSGAVADIVRLDNDRLLASRKERLLAAAQKTATAAIKLSLYARGRDGVPLRVSPRALPLPPAPALDVAVDLPATATDGEITAALSSRPEPAIAALTIAKTAVTIALADNDEQARLDVELDAGYGIGAPLQYGDQYASKSGPRAGGRIVLSWPWPQRMARGALATARAIEQQARAEQQLWREVVAAEVRAAHVVLAAARERMIQAQRAATAAHRLERAEWRRFDLGQSDLVVVNLRESHSADAEAKAVKAWGELQAARLRLAVAGGRMPLGDLVKAKAAAPR